MRIGLLVCSIMSGMRLSTGNWFCCWLAISCTNSNQLHEVVIVTKIDKILVITVTQAKTWCHVVKWNAPTSDASLLGTSVLQPPSECFWSGFIAFWAVWLGSASSMAFCISVLHRESKKRHYTLVHIFAKYRPIFIILSLTHSVGNLQ